jgi:hypothetical protein
LGHLKEAIIGEGPDLFSMQNKSKVLSVEKEYDTDIITLFHATGDFQHRGRWYVGVEKVELVNHFLPRVGMKCRVFLPGKEVFIYSSSYRYQEHRIEFSEMDEEKSSATWFTLERMSPKRTKLTIDFYVTGGIASRLGFRLFRKKKFEERFRKSMENLVRLVKELRIPSAV